MATSRRTFLKIGTVAALALAAGGGIYRATHPKGASRFMLSGEARAVIDALVPVMLGSVLPSESAARSKAIATTTDGVNRAILGLPLFAQKEVQDLFGLLALAPARRLLAGVSDSWEQATPEQVAAFLQGWRFHRFGMLRAAYFALHDLVIGAWYGNASSWADIGYPGPIKELA
jgi:hypothetical protein